MSEIIINAADALSMLKKHYFRGLKEMIADAPELVRCKDCKNYYCIIGRGDDEIWGCRFVGRDTAPNAFCSYGERKDNE